MRIIDLLSKCAFIAAMVSTPALATTTSGFDTANDIDLVFAVGGSQVGDWNSSQLTITGGLQTIGSGIRAGYDADLCNPVIEGTQRYSASVHNYEFCNGTSWVPFGQGSPTGEVAFFLAYTCPSGWIPSDGSNGTVDMRGEFPRGWDNGRGADRGRALGSWEDATGIGQTIEQAAFIQDWNPDAQQYAGGSVSRAGLNGYADSQLMFKVRPRNVALLACAKS